MKTIGSLTVDANCYSGQSKGCAVCVQVRYTRFLWHPKWANGRDGAAVDVFIAAPVHDPEIGYRCRRWGIRLDRKRRMVTV